MSRGSSRRRTRLPTKVSVLVVVVAMVASYFPAPAAAAFTALTMCWYPVQRHTLPSRPWRISSSVGDGWRSIICFAAMIIPGVQNPHWRPCSFQNASCMGSSLPSLTRQRGFAKMARPDKSRESRHRARAKQHDNATSSERSIKDCSAGGLAGHDSDGGDDVAVASLHRLSPEFDPSWRRVSEYAFGHYRWVLSLMFLSWEVSSWALAMAIWSQVNTNSGKVGLWFLVVAGIGEAMASFFDVTHDTGHGIAGLLGVGGFPVAALLLSASLGRTEAWSSTKKTLLWIANLAKRQKSVG